MADTKDSGSFFRKVVKFVANPATEWNDLAAPSSHAREAEFAKHELKAMIERKRRNDFVRKREFDMLRKVRREGLTGEQLAALGLSSRLDDSDGRPPELRARADVGVKAKIDAIEQQMTGAPYLPSPRPSAAFYSAPTQPAELSPASAVAPAGAASPPVASSPPPPPKAPPPMAADAPFSNRVPSGTSTGAATEAAAAADQPILSTRATGVMAPGLSPLATQRGAAGEAGHRRPGASDNPFAVEIIEIAHDPELDEAVIAFANADFDLCENALSTLVAPDAPRAAHAPTWLALFDLYRATGTQGKFEALAPLYAQRFGSSAPQWFSLPKLVAAAATQERRHRPGADAQVSWVAPEWLDSDAVAALRSRGLQMPLPWVFDWSALGRIDPEACTRLSELFRSWIPQRIDMRWLQGDRFFKILADAAPTGARDVDPAYWQLRFDALRMVNRPDQFDEVAIDYCVTYEVSPPSWEPCECRVRIAGEAGVTLSPMTAPAPNELSSSFVESQILESPDAAVIANVELSGQLIGDISSLLVELDAQLGVATTVNVSCSRLIRVDFIAAGDLLNWVLARRAENRSVGFIEAHRLVALFFGAMGINEHAQVRVRAI